MPGRHNIIIVWWIYPEGIGSGITDRIRREFAWVDQPKETGLEAAASTRMERWSQEHSARAIIFPMKYETVQGVRIPKIGFGTWTIGGKDNPDPRQDEKSLAALHSALELGYTHFDTAEAYSGGHAEELVGRAIRESGLGRETLFITSKVSPEHLRYDDVVRCCENSLRRLGMDYIDLYLIHWPMRGMDLAEAFRALNKLVSDGKVKHLGVSNFDHEIDWKRHAALSETPLLTNQVSYSLADRSCEKNGVLAYCQNNDILLTAYSPVKRRYIGGDNKVAGNRKGKGRNGPTNCAGMARTPAARDHHPDVVQPAAPGGEPGRGRHGSDTRGIEATGLSFPIL